MKDRRGRRSAVIAAFLLAASSCTTSAVAPSGTPAPTATVRITPDPLPTRTPRLEFPPITPAPDTTPVAVPGTGSVLKDEVVQTGLEVPWDMAFTPDGRMLVTERNKGVVDVFASGAPAAPKLATLTVDGVIYSRTSEEDGLLGIAVDPRFASNGFVYVCASRHDPDLNAYLNQVLRYKLTGTSWTLDGFVIREGITAEYLHDGCRIRFDGTGHLWVTMGENWQFNPAQDPNSMLGKILRVNPDGSIPADNPILPGARARTAIYSMGHRNPQGIAIAGGDVYVIEHGPDVDDEINYILPAANYGWPDLRDTGGPAKGMRDPIWTSGPVTYAPSGGAFANGALWGSWSGSLFVATLKAQSLRRFSVTPTKATQQEILLEGKYGRLRGVTQGPDGALYVSTSNLDGRGANVQKPGDDRIIRMAPSAP
jgi:glucose/arabinose dehydrogenase